MAHPRVNVTDPANSNYVLAINPDGSADVRDIGAPNFFTSQVSVAATDTLVAAARAGRVAITIENNGTTDVFIGSAGVTTGTGFLLPGVKGAALTIPTAAEVHGISSTGSQTVSVLETA